MELPHTVEPTETTTVEKSNAELGRVVSIDEGKIRDHLGELVRGTVEETLNAMLDAEAEAMCGAGRYERTSERSDYRSGHYDRKLHTKAGEVKLKMPKLQPRAVTFSHPAFNAASPGAESYEPPVQYSFLLCQIIGFLSVGKIPQFLTSSIMIQAQRET